MKKGLLILISTVLLLSGCKLTNFFRSEKDRFVGATSEALCLIFTSENPMAPSKDTSDKVKAIYSNYGFNADDQTGMEAITKKYEQDQEVKDITAEALKKCSGIDVNAPAKDSSTAPVTDGSKNDVVPKADDSKIKTEDATKTPAVKPAK